MTPVLLVLSAVALALGLGCIIARIERKPPSVADQQRRRRLDTAARSQAEAYYGQWWEPSHTERFRT